MSTALSFRYRARDSTGSEQRGQMQAASSTAVARALRERGWVPVDIHAQTPQRAKAPGAGSTGAAPASGGFIRSLGKSFSVDGGSAAISAPGNQAAAAASAPNPAPTGVRRRQSKRVQTSMSLVMRELAALLRAGVPLLRGLRLAGDAAAEATVRAALQRIATDLDRGLSLVAAAEREHRQSGLLSDYDIAMLQVGQQTGRLPEAFSELHRQREFSRRTAEQVGAALRYPAFVILTCVLALVVVNLFVIPSFAKVFAQARAELPTLTLLLLGMSNAMIRWWPMLLLAAGSGALGWQRWTASERGRLWWDRVKLRLPIVGSILEGIVMSRLSASLASAIGAGLTVSDALVITARTLGNRWVESRLQQMCNDLARGASITTAARQMNVLPPTMLQMFAIGEESGSIEELMKEISAHYQAEVDHAIGGLSATIEPLMIWILGSGVLVLALGIFMPMWDLGRASLR